MNRLALTISTLALAAAAGVLVWAVFLGDDSEPHRCGPYQGTVGSLHIACVGNDAPIEFTRRGCAPLFREDGVTVWRCVKGR